MIDRLRKIDARWIGDAFAKDPDLFMPERPRLIPELEIVELGTDGLVFSGGEHNQVIRGRSLSLLRRLIPLIDGRSIEELAEATKAKPRDVRDVVGLLFSRGLLEDGAPKTAKADSAVGQWLGRFVDVTRYNRNREEAMDRLIASSVAILGGEYAFRMVEILKASGFENLVYWRTAAEVDTGRRFDLAVVVSSGDEDESSMLARAAVDVSAQVLLLRLGARTGHIGPFFAKGVTCCLPCFLRRHAHPEGLPQGEIAEYVTCIGALLVLNATSRISPTTTQREFRILRLNDREELEQELLLPVRTVGCPDCGLPGSDLAHDDSRLIAWLYHSSTSLPAREQLSPRDHQLHYKMDNLMLAKKEKVDLAAIGESVLLQAAQSNDPLPVLSLATLTAILLRCGGEWSRNGETKRIAPTGGNLGSVDLWVVANEVEGLPRGIYRYDARRHRLQWARKFSGTTAAATIGCESAPACLLLATGDLARCVQKYKNFAYRLIFYDAGVSLAYLRTVSGVLGIDMMCHPGFDMRSAYELLGIPLRWDFPVPTFAVTLGPTPPTRRSVQLPWTKPPLVAADYSAEDLLVKMLEGAIASLGFQGDPRPRPTAGVGHGTDLQHLDRILFRRRAVREYTSSGVSRRDAEAVLRAGCEMLGNYERSCALNSFVQPILVIAREAQDIGPGIYAIDELGKFKQHASFSPDWMRESFNQNSFGQAPAAIFTLGDLGLALSERGIRGYSELALAAGTIVGSAWLEAVARGLGGSAAGGVLPAGLKGAFDADGFRKCPLLAFPFGHVAASE